MAGTKVVPVTNGHSYAFRRGYQATVQEIQTEARYNAGVKDPTRSPRVSDTAPAAVRVDNGTLRSLGIEGRARLTFAACDSLRSIVASGIRNRHPDYDDETVRLAFLQIWLGPDLFRVIYPGVEVTP